MADRGKRGGFTESPATEPKWRHGQPLSCQNSLRHSAEEAETKARRHYEETSTEAADYMYLAQREKRRIHYSRNADATRGCIKSVATPALRASPSVINRFSSGSTIIPNHRPLRSSFRYFSTGFIERGNSISNVPLFHSTVSSYTRKTNTRNGNDQ